MRYGDALAKPGDIIYVRMTAATEGGEHRASLEEDSGTQGALMAIDNTSGDVLAMVGGRDYAVSVFNRATQAERQTGSSFKPYVYTAAIEDGVKPTDIIVDGPMRFGDYVPHNYENDYKGAMTVANAFAESRNIPGAQAGRARGHSQGDRRGPSLRRHFKHSALPAGGAGRGGDHASKSRWRRTRYSPTTVSAWLRTSSAKFQTPTESRCGRRGPRWTRCSTSKRRAP